MKAMILAAGLGNRMRPLTLHTPKPLLTVADTPLIVWHIRKLQSVGVKEIVINTAWLADKLVDALGDGSKFNVKILWSHEGEGLETAGGIINALPLLGDEPFILINGDVWTDMDFTEFKNIQLKNTELTHLSDQVQDQLAHLILVKNPEQHPKGDFILSDGKAYTFEQNQQGEALTYSGLAIISPQLFVGLDAGKRPLAPILKEAMQQERVGAHKMQANWVDVGTPERLHRLDEMVKLNTVDLLI